LSNMFHICVLYFVCNVSIVLCFLFFKKRILKKNFLHL
jgi:hypothetical protein